MLIIQEILIFIRDIEMITKRLMSSVSSVAIVVAGAQQASADAHSALSGYTLNVQGGIGAVDNIWDDKTGSEDLSDKVGSEDNLTSYMGSLTLSRETSPNKDMAFGLSFGVSPQDNSFKISSGFSSGFSGSGVLTIAGRDSNSYAALDFEMGTTVPMGTADMRWFYGARALASKSNFSYDIEVDKAGSGSGGSLEVEAESVFVGVGPRVGIGFATQPAPGSQFGFSGELGAAVLFGSRKDTLTLTTHSGFSLGSGGSSFSSFSERKNVASLDAQIGVDYYLSDNATISAGYQLQQLWNVDLASDEDNDASDDRSRLIHGVFVGFTTQF